MATAVHMQPPASRPSMDRAPSFDQPRTRSAPPFQVAQTTRSPSPNIRPHSRTSSNASASSPYAQPFANNYFPPQGPMYSFPSQPPQAAWSANAIPANSFYPSPMQLNPGQSFHQGFQQNQAEFAAWATAYHQMVRAGAGMNQIPHPQSPPEYLDERRRLSTGPSANTAYSGTGGGDFYGAGYGGGSGHAQSGSQSSLPRQFPQTSPAQQQPAAFHPYKRGPSHRSSRENMNGAANAGGSGGMPRSVSQPSLSPTESQFRHSPANSVSTPPPEIHRRTSSLDQSTPRPTVTSSSSTPRAAARQDSCTSEKERTGRSTPTFAAPVRSASPASSGRSTATASSKSATTNTASQDRPKVSQPLHTGPIANATNTPNPAAARPSPLSQTPTSASEPEKAKSPGFKSRFKKVVDKESSTTPKKQSSPPAFVKHPSVSKPTFASPSETSTRSATPPTTPPHPSNFSPPSAPFAVSHPGSMGSDLSLAETERTATGPSEMGATTGKPKRSLFRMKNMSTDNISLSSTVSSASMMIRRMGSLGKLARRNSLMGISKIFKDKPKDDDAPLPEKEAKKKEKKNKKNKKTKAEAAPAAISHATAEPERSFTEDDDRALAGLSPAAKLARQHTLRSKEEQEKKAKAAAAAKADKKAGKTGEPAWDNNTATRHNNTHANGVLPPISSVASGTPAPIAVTANGPAPGQAPEIRHITPGRMSTVVHAVQVSEQEYDSDDDSSDGETIEDVTSHLSRARLSDSSAIADQEFRENWQSAWIDKNAVPKKGILRVTTSMEALEQTASRQRSNSTAQVPQAQSGPMVHPPSDANRIDGLNHGTADKNVRIGREEILNASPADTINDERYNPFSASFAPFESPSALSDVTSPYAHPGLNSSMPTLSLINPAKSIPLATRSMTAPSARKRLMWAPECAVYATYDAMTYDRRSEPATCNRLTPELAMQIKQELNTFKMEMPVHPESRSYIHFFA